MKNILFAAVALFISSGVSAQKISLDNVPADVQSTFKNKYSTAQKVSWELDYDNYEAEFTFLNTQMTAEFDKEGNWRETHSYIKSTELPKEVKDSLAKQFGKVLSMYKIEDVEKVEIKDNEVLYQMNVTKDNITYEMMLSEKGETIKKDAKKPEEKAKKATPKPKTK